MYAHIKDKLLRIKANRPLILNITNHVTMDFIANGLLSLGASPIMTLATQEVDDLIQHANGVVINLGTLNDEFIELCHAVCRTANRVGKPITLDPVGAGASHYRTKTCLDLLAHYAFAIIRGNASEIMALSNATQNTKGVDASIATQDAIESGQYLASHYQTVVVISGKTDAVIDANHVGLSDYGSPLMPMITGSGCLLSAVVSAFDAVHDNRFDAMTAAIAFYGMCGEQAAKKSTGPGSFKSCFLDELSFLPKSHQDEKH